MSLLLATLTCLAIAAPASAGTRHRGVVSENPADFTPNVPTGVGGGDGSVLAFAQYGTDAGLTYYAGGRIGTVENAARTRTYQRNGFVAFNRLGQVLAAAPVFSGGEGAPYEMVRWGGSLYVAGHFTAVNGIPRNGLVKLRLPALTVDPAFRPASAGAAFDVQVVNRRVIVAGKFPQRLMALDPVTGADTGYLDIDISGQVTATTPTKVEAFAVAGNRLLAIGHFTSVAGQSRRQAFMLALGETSAVLTPWHSTRFDGTCNLNTGMWVRTVDASPDGSYFVVAAAGGSSTRADVLCDGIARFEAADSSSSARPTWINWTGSDSVYATTVTGAAVYVGGHFRYLDNVQGARCDPCPAPAVRREGIGALDPVTGRALPWNPGKTRGHGVEELWASAEGLWVGSDGQRFNGEYREAIAFAPLPGVG